MTEPASLTQVEIRPGVAAIVRDDAGRVLLHRRVVGNGWAPPSGSVEPGETLLQAALREVQEETTLVVEVVRLIAVYSDPTYQIVDYPDGKSVHFVTCLFECGVVRGDLQGSEEGSEWGWFDFKKPPINVLPYASVWLADAKEHDERVRIR